jgi:hypothetical protein
MFYERANIYLLNSLGKVGIGPGNIISNTLGRHNNPRTVGYAVHTKQSRQIGMQKKICIPYSSGRRTHPSQLAALAAWQRIYRQ